MTPNIDRPRNRRRWAALLLLCVGPWLAWKLFLRHHHLSFVPEALDVGWVQYASEERWGLPLLGLPGDNETGILVYRLPARIAMRIQREDSAFFRPLPADAVGVAQDWHGRSENWLETPFDAEARSRMTWVYLDTPRDCGFCVRVDPAVWAEVNEIIGTPGSYYAFGRIGVIVVSPRRRWVI